MQRGKDLNATRKGKDLRATRPAQLKPVGYADFDLDAKAPKPMR